MGKLDNLAKALDRKKELASMPRAELENMVVRQRGGDTATLALKADIAGIGELQEAVSEGKEETAKKLQEIMDRLDDLESTVWKTWTQNEEGFATKHTSIFNAVKEMRQIRKAVENIELPAPNVDNVVKKWDFKIKRGPGGLMKSVEAVAQ